MKKSGNDIKSIFTVFGFIILFVIFANSYDTYDTIWNTETAGLFFSIIGYALAIIKIQELKSILNKNKR